MKSTKWGKEKYVERKEKEGREKRIKERNKV